MGPGDANEPDANQHLLKREHPPCTERQSLTKACEWKDGDRGGLAEGKQDQGKKKAKVCFDINRSSYGVDRRSQREPEFHSLVVDSYVATLIAGGFYVPSIIEGGVSSGQCNRSMGMNFAFGAINRQATTLARVSLYSGFS